MLSNNRLSGNVSPPNIERAIAEFVHRPLRSRTALQVAVLDTREPVRVLRDTSAQRRMHTMPSVHQALVVRFQLQEHRRWKGPTKC